MPLCANMRCHSPFAPISTIQTNCDFHCVTTLSESWAPNLWHSRLWRHHLCLVKVFFAIEKWLKTVYNLTSLRINVVFRVSCPCTRTCHRTSYEQTLISLSFSCGRRQTPSYGRTTSNASANTWNAHSNTMSSVARANDIGPCVSVQWKLCHTRNSHLRYFFSYSHHQ